MSKRMTWAIIKDIQTNNISILKTTHFEAYLFRDFENIFLLILYLCILHSKLQNFI